ncbi:GOLPH3/VPS74 family protein [Micromonospora cathayae]|uniref:GPP34 family phosphoprotein n=1 Tax=Micromonospora cathayae TaxID=3028804 RepID=A0ABY7ZLW0_9ACTN|nr:GPP34 family phosphoprotein [Micromonospora sp. HUAS 3]WDZ83959.1 GPP34 family phosphoprotein [Micromonospora sp. HUAS 3]
MTTAPTERTNPPTLVEDLLLLLFQPASGTIAGENTLFYVLGGAALADLALGDHLTTTGRGRVSSVAGHPPPDGLLRPAWDYLAEKPRGVQTALAAIGPALREPALQRLIARGDIDQQPRKVLGLFPSTALREGRTERRARLLADVRQVLVEGVEPTARVAALTALVSASGTLPWFHREIPWTSPVITRAKDLERGDWGADAAAAAVTRTVTATVVSSTIVAVTVLPHPTPPR